MLNLFSVQVWTFVSKLLIIDRSCGMLTQGKYSVTWRQPMARWGGCKFLPHLTATSNNSANDPHMFCRGRECLMRRATSRYFPVFLVTSLVCNSHSGLCNHVTVLCIIDILHQPHPGDKSDSGQVFQQHVQTLGTDGPVDWPHGLRHWSILISNQEQTLRFYIK